MLLKYCKSKLCAIGVLFLSLTFSSFLQEGKSSFVVAEDSVDATVETIDYCSDYKAFAERFLRPGFPQVASEQEQRGWFLAQKTCGRDLIKLTLVKYPVFEQKPEDASQDAWDNFLATVARARFNIGEAIFDENHGGTLIRKYYTAKYEAADYEINNIVILKNVLRDELATVMSALEKLTSDEEWKANARIQIDLFYSDFSRWFAPFCQASLDKLPPVDSYKQNPDLFLTALSLLEFALEYIPDNEDFVQTLNGIEALLQDPEVGKLRVFHGRYEGSELISREAIFARYCDRINAISQRQKDGVLQPRLMDASIFNERQTELFEHSTLKCWGAQNPEQKDHFYVVFPKKGELKDRPLYVVLHSAGHTAQAALACTAEENNHDIYTVPDDFYGLFVDCFDNREYDWWWGGRRADEPEINEGNEAKSGTDLLPVEKRVLDEIAWTISTYNIDPNRVYLSGCSMGGSGTLGIGLRNGDVFAAIKANVPAGIWHAYDRLQMSQEAADFAICDPPVCVDYSAPNDQWSLYHEYLFKGMDQRKYSYIAYWGSFGHANKTRNIMEFNDLIDSFDWLEVKKNEAYAVFTNASTDDPSPWPDDLENETAGQRGAFFRWKNLTDTEDDFSIELRLASDDEIQSKIFKCPTESTADVSLRRLQNFKTRSGDVVLWTYGDLSGEIVVDDQNIVTIPNVKIATQPTTLKLQKK